MRALIIKDPHFRFGFDKPRGRTETFHTDILDKLKQIVELGKEHKTTNLIITGDVFDIKAKSLYTLDIIKENFTAIQLLKRQFKNIYTIAGNHDLPYASLQEKPHSFYQFCIDNQLFHDIASNPTTIDNTYLYGIDYQGDWNKTLAILNHHDTKDNNPKVVVIHEYLVPVGESLNMETHSYKELEHLKNHTAIITGHLHKGYPTDTSKTPIIVNQWNMTRLARGYMTQEHHTPEVTLIDIDLFETTITHIPLKVKDYHSCFMVDDNEKEKTLDNALYSFTQRVLESGFSQVLDFDENAFKSKFEANFDTDKIKEKIHYYLELAKRQVVS